MGRKRGASSAPVRATKRQKKVMTLAKKVELLDMLRSVRNIAAVSRHYGINESTVRSIQKQERELREAVAVATPEGAKTLRQMRDPFLSRVENATFLWVKDCYKQGIPVDVNLIRWQAKFLYDSIKEKEGKGSTRKAFTASKGWFHNFQRRFDLYNVKITEEQALTDQEAASGFTATLMEVIGDKGYEREQVFNAGETVLFWKRMLQGTSISREKKEAPRFILGTDKLTMLFCANAAGHMVKPAMIYKAPNSQAWKGKDKSQLPVFWMDDSKTWTIRTLFLDWFRLCFVPEVRTYLANKGKTFKVLLILASAPGYPETQEFNTEGVEVLYLPPNTRPLIQPLDQGVIRSFKAHYTHYVMERIVQHIKESSSLQNAMETWGKYTIDDAMMIIERAIKTIKPEAISWCWKSLWPDGVNEVASFTGESIQAIMEDTVDLVRKAIGERFKGMDVGEIQDLIDTSPHQSIEEDLMDLIAPEEAPKEEEDEKEEELPDDEFTLDNIAEGLQKIKSATDYFYDIDPSVIRSLKFKELVDAALLPYKKIFEEMRQRSQAEMYFRKVTPSIPASFTASTSAATATLEGPQYPPPPSPPLQTSDTESTYSSE